MCFCDLVHLVQRSFNTLKEMVRWGGGGWGNHDIDNRMLAQRMCMDDLMVWAHHIESNGKEALLAQLIAWMTTEMTSRVRATEFH